MHHVAAARRSLVVLVGCLLVSGLVPVSAEEPGNAPKLAEYFGFQPLEIYKLDRRIKNLQVCDLDGDKTGDVITSNNARSRIDLLLSTKVPEGEAESRPFRRDANDINYDKRMRLVSIPVNKEIVSIDTGDFNGDGKPDLVYYGTPAEVEIFYNEGPGRFGNSKKITTGEAIESAGALAVGDLNQDGKDDIALLAENDIILVYQSENGVLSEPERVPHTSASPQMLKLRDIDGNGSLDLVILNGGTEYPIHIRFATDEKKLGPEQRFQIEAPRAIAFGQIDGKGGQEILTIEGQSGRGKVLSLDESDVDEQNKWGRLIFFGLPQGGDRGRSLAIGDLDGDKKTDVVVSDAVNAQVWLYRQSAHNGLNAGQSFPGLLGGKTVRLADLDRDGKSEIYVMSEQERQIGRSTLADGRIGFPSPLPTAGDPVAMDLADLDGDGVAEILYIVKAKSAAGADQYDLKALKRDPSGDFKPFTWAGEQVVTIPGLGGAPAAIKAIDVNQDQLADLFIFPGFGAPILLLGQKDQAPKPFTGSLGPMGAASPTSLSVMNLDGPAPIVAQNTFARRVLLDAQNQWGIKDQYNSGRTAAQIQGAAILDLDGDGDKDVVLLDKVSKSLMFLSLRDGVYRPAGNLPIGSIAFEGLHVADFDSDGRDDLLIAGSDRFGVLQTGRKGQRLKTLATYESKRTEARFSDLIAGDLNADHVPDILFADSAEQMLEIASYGSDKDLIPALSFKLFERKLYRSMSEQSEPRDMAIGDVDGDGREDLVLIVHDRILILRQDPGSPEKKPAAEEASQAARR